MPAAFLKYFKDLGETQVYITSFDGSTGRIYPISVWKQNESVFETAGVSDSSEDAEDVLALANYYGEDSDIDSAGKILLPTTLRREMSVEGEQVWMDYAKGRINFYSDAVYKARLAKAREDVAAKVKKLSALGLR